MTRPSRRVADYAPATPYKADITAAERAMNKAVRRVIEEYKRDRPDVAPGTKGYDIPEMTLAAKGILAAACITASLLLGEA